jgi:hypothetical protein
MADLEAALEAIGEAVTATRADDDSWAHYRVNQGLALRSRFERTRAAADLDASINAIEEAVAATAEGRPEKAGRLSDLGGALLRRFQVTRMPEHLAAAISASRAAVQASPADHPARAGMLFNLGHAVRLWFQQTETPSARNEALSAYMEAAHASQAAPSLRILAAREAASLATRSDPGQAADLLEGAVRLLPEVAPRQLGRTDQQDAIGTFAGLAAEAAANALADPRATEPERALRALQLLEAARAVLLSQALDTRSDLTDLQRQHPGLAARFTELRGLLDEHSDTVSPVASPASDVSITSWATRAVEERRQLADDLAATMASIRALDGFSSFGLPPATSDLLAQARHGPVVTFNISASRSDALLLTADGIRSVSLPGLARQAVIDQITAFHLGLNTLTSLGMTTADRIAGEATIRETLEWLWESAAEPVLDALGYCREPRPAETWPRVWWAPGGLLGALPIHAAGYHADPHSRQGRRTVIDRVISSYTPTIRALHYARQRSPAAAGRIHALIVAMPTTPGLPGRLSNVPDEVARVGALLPDHILLAEHEGVTESASTSAGIPTRVNVLTQLSRCSIAHFSCHGATDTADPSRSLLFLHDHRTDPLTVASLGPVELSHAQIAFLSACWTAHSDNPGLLDEAIHLTSAFQLAGFPHVIGTLWPINDAVAVEIAATFYTSLRESGDALDTSRAADALHRSVRDVRDKLPRSPFLWAAYLHVGA